MLEDERGLDQTGHAGGGFQVAEIRLARADRQRLGAIFAAERLGQGVRLDGITDRGAGAVGFNETDRRGIDAGVRARVAHELRLRVRAGEQMPFVWPS